MVPVSKANHLLHSQVTIRMGCMGRQEISLQLVLQQHVVLRSKAKARPEREQEF